MKTLFPLALVLALGAAISQARLGETLEECQARYGVMIGTDMTRSDYPAYVFRKDGIEIRVRLYNGKSAQEIFFGIGSELSSEQMIQIDHANFRPDVKAHSETYVPSIEADAKRLLGIGVKVTQIEAYKAVPVGINGDDGKGHVLSVTTYEFRGVFGGINGF